MGELLYCSVVVTFTLAWNPLSHISAFKKFRYFLQPFLVAYYLPLFIIRGLTGPARRQAKARHEATKARLRDAIEFAKKNKVDAYVPVKVNGELKPRV